MDQLREDRAALQAAADVLSLSRAELLEYARQPESPLMREAHEAGARLMMARVREIEEELRKGGLSE